jgi:predicted TIM-barrel fold metal-dependent hydrolase
MTSWRVHREAAIELFGPERCMFESNFPVDGKLVDYCALWNAFKKAVAGYSADERQAMLCDNAVRIYRLDLPGAP